METNPDPNAIRVTTRTVLVPTTVKDKDSGDFVNGLTVNDFRIFDNDRPQKISTDFSYEPLSVVAVIQANSDVEPMIPKMRKLGVLLQGLVNWGRRRYCRARLRSPDYAPGGLDVGPEQAG